MACWDTSIDATRVWTAATQRRLSLTTSLCLHSANTCQLVSGASHPSLHCRVSMASLSPRLAITVIEVSHPKIILFTTVAAAWSLTCDMRPTQRSAETIATVSWSHSLFLVRWSLRWSTFSAAIMILRTSHTTGCPSHVIPHPCSSGAISCRRLSVGLNTSIALSACVSDMSLPLSCLSHIALESLLSGWLRCHSTLTLLPIFFFSLNSAAHTSGSAYTHCS